MARVKMITREVNSYKAMAVTVDLSKGGTLVNQEFNLDENCDTEKALTVIRKKYETATTKIVAVTEVKAVSVMLGMTLDDFMKYAVPLDPETRKMLDD